MQLNLSVLNASLDALNKHIEDVQARESQASKARLESFTEDEMASIVGDKLDGKPVKTVILGLVHCKRLDVTTENCIKVYKVRRFY